jgi:phosphatidylserine/phosphatidylglycerophosphate/cardiolipin synthase-like enzyme
MAGTLNTSSHKDGLSVKAYQGDGAVMLAFDLDEHLTQNLAGFAVQFTPPKGKPSYLLNRLNFSRGIHAGTTPGQRMWTPSDQAPFQKFRWVDFPADVPDGTAQYTVTAMYFQNDGSVRKGPSVDVEVDPGFFQSGKLEMGFTRGYMSSQAYAAKFKNAPIRPSGNKTATYNTKPFEKQYQWLGFHARKMVFDFLNECLQDKSVSVELFAYDLDEPEFIQGLVKLGPRLRAFLDDAPLHTKPGAVEPQAKALLVKSAGAGNVKTGHFKRFAHNKVLIQKKNGKPMKVLTGSANFSVRGFYVQANNVLIFDDPETAASYSQAFNQAFNDPSKSQAQFPKSPIAKQWFDVKDPGLPIFSVCFSPHTSDAISLAKVAQEIAMADSSVLFAVMELGGGGTVLQELQKLPANTKIFSYGVTQSVTGLKLYKPGSSNGLIVPFAFLQSKIPAPFASETSGGAGQVIHNKFVVVDFNDSEPVVFTGSSNLASGGETSNGDNLLAIYDRSVATAYAVEAIRLVDHYHFRAAMKGATKAQPLTLEPARAPKPWWTPYYDPRTLKNRERLLFIR